MKTKAVYEVESGGSVRVFSESMAGGFDFEGARSASEAEKLALELLAGDCARTELVSTDDDFGCPIYRRRAILDGQPEQEPGRRIEAYLESIEVLLMTEPYNLNDSNAVSVLMRFPYGGTEQARYVKREIAAILAPLMAEGVTLSGIDALYEGDVDVQVRAG